VKTRFSVTCAHFRTWRKKRNRAVAAIRQARKAAKDDGLSLGDLDAIRRLAKKEKHEIVSIFNTQVLYASFLDVPVIGQLEMFEVPSEDVNWEAEARQDGERSAKLGRNENENPHDEGTPAHAAWVAGFADGKSKIGGDE
jgi:NACalpha-BTF3-like transcription factor